MSNKTKFLVQHTTLLILMILTLAKIGTFFNGNSGISFIALGILVVGSIVGAICYLSYIFGWNFDNYRNKMPEDYYEKGILNFSKLKLTFLINLGILLIGLMSLYTPVKSVYNSSKVYVSNKKQKEQQRIAFYDNMYKTYNSKEKLFYGAKETFITLASMQMEARKDGTAIAWKWVQENSPMPYDQFLKAYADLSNYIESRRNEFYNIELQIQNIVMSQNMLLDTFPNNIYNSIFLHQDKLEYKTGVISNHTKIVFQKGIED